MRFLNTQGKEVTKWKETASNYQRAFASQEEALQSEKGKRAFVVQSLSYEADSYKATQRSLEQERAYIRDFIGFLDTLEVLRRSDPEDNASIGTLWLERNGIKGTLEQLEAKTKSLEQELRSTRDKLQHKRFLLEELSQNFEVAAQSTSMSPAFESSGEEIKIKVLLSELDGQRKRVRT